jgi:hypothetical protein
MRVRIGLLCLVALTAWAPRALAARPFRQVEMDRIVSRVDGRILTQSDVDQARRLKLVDDASSDLAVRRALENRFLILGELSRSGSGRPPTDAEIAARRAEWAATLGGAAAASSALSHDGMNDADLTGWMRDDVRIRAYLQRQFGMLTEGDRARAQGDWIGRLRLRANLP